MFENKSYEAHEDHKNLYDALEKSLECDYSDQLLSDLEEARQKKRKRCDLPRTPSGSPPPQLPHPPPPAGAFGALGTSEASGSSQLPPPPPPLSTGTFVPAQQQGSKALSLSKSAASTLQSMACITSNTRYESAGVFGTQELSLTDSLIQDDSIPDKQERPVTPEPTWTITSSNVSDVENNWATTYSRYGYDYLSEIVLRRANLQEYTIAEKDFKNLHSSDFEDLNLLLPQDHLDHLPGFEKQMLSTAVKLWTQNLVIRQQVEDF
nr:hypothetical protein [Tanacetum cinerariifolium]